MNLRKLIKETLEFALLCEVKIDIEDTKKRGFAQQIGQMYKDALKELKPIKIYGKLGVESAHSSQDSSLFIITLKNGDVINAFRNTNPAFAKITINKTSEYQINSQELFANKFPELIKKYYLEYKTAKAGIPSI
jgi:hypothetical protein